MFRHELTPASMNPFLWLGQSPPVLLVVLDTQGECSRAEINYYSGYLKYGNFKKGTFYYSTQNLKNSLIRPKFRKESSKYCLFDQKTVEVPLLPVKVSLSGVPTVDQKVNFETYL